MVRVEDVRDRQAAREQEAAARRQEAITRFGETLGEAYLNYTQGSSRTREEHTQKREAFADAIVTALESGTHEEKVQAMTALLGSFEAKIAPVARQAAEADSRTAPIG